jgi:hypothetical protein
MLSRARVDACQRTTRDAIYNELATTLNTRGNTRIRGTPQSARFRGSGSIYGVRGELTCTCFKATLLIALAGLK